MDLEDDHSAAHLMFIHTSRWLSFRLEMTTFVLFDIMTVLFVELSRSQLVNLPLTASEVGTTLTTVNNLLGMIQWGIRQSVETEVSLTSVERLINFARLQPERDTVVDKVKQADVKD